MESFKMFKLSLELNKIYKNNIKVYFFIEKFEMIM